MIFLSLGLLMGMHCKPAYLVPVQARIKWEGCSRKGIWHKKWGDDGGGSLISPDGVALSRLVSVSASVIFPCTVL